METIRFPLVFLDIARIFCHELPGADYRGAAAERQSGGSRRRVRWCGKSDGFWAAWCGDDSFPGDDVVRGDVHGLRPGFGAESRSWPESGRFGDLQHDETGRYEARGDTGSDDSCSSNADSCNSGACNAAATTTAASSCFSAASEKVGLIRLRATGIAAKIVSITLVRQWRNWQTHQLEGLGGTIP